MALLLLNLGDVCEHDMLGEIRSSLGELRSLLLLCLGECEGTSGALVSQLDRPIVNMLLGQKMVGNITVETAGVRRGKKHQECLGQLLKLHLSAGHLGCGIGCVSLSPHGGTSTSRSLPPCSASIP